MKQIFLMLGCFITLNALAQTPITITRADMPRPTSTSPLPDSVLYTIVLGSAMTAQNTGGANATWNIGWPTGVVAYQNFVAMTSTPLIYQLAFLSCDYAQPLVNGGNFGTGTLSNAFEYMNYTTSNTRLESKGFGADILIPGQTIAIPLAAVYSSPDVIYKFPITYGDMDSSNSAFNVSLTLPTIGAIEVKRQQKRVNSVDAWGSLTTPAGTFDVLRVTSNIDRMDSTILSIISLGIPSQTVEYKWLGAGKKIPVLQINGTIAAGNFTPTTTTFWGEGPASVGNSLNSDNAFSIYPNPAHDFCSVETNLNQNSDLKIEIVSMTGQRVGHFEFKNIAAGKNAVQIPVMGLSAGNYAIRVSTGNTAISTKLVSIQ